MTTTTRYTMHAAVVLATRAVYGVGATPAAALADGLDWTDSPEAHKALEIVPCTPEAAAYVNEMGGAPSSDLVVSSDGVYLRSEE